MQRALDALLAWEEESSGFGWSKNDEECVALLRTRLAQPKRAWQGLTDEDVESVWSRLRYELSGNKFDDEPLLGSTVLFARAIEETLRDKNGD
jgi:hypothetical protein